MFVFIDKLKKRQQKATAAILDLNSIEENSSNHVFLLLVAVDYNYDN